MGAKIEDSCGTALEKIQLNALLSVIHQRFALDFTEYHQGYDDCIIKGFIKRKVVFANHHLANDGIFTESQLVSCRNVLIYFNNRLKKKVLKQLTDNLAANSFIALDDNEIIFAKYGSDRMQLFNRSANIYRIKSFFTTIYLRRKTLCKL